MTWVAKLRARKQTRKKPPRRPRKRTRRDGLYVIALLLALSGTIRLGLEAGSAVASGAERVGQGTPEACASDDIAVVLAALKDRETRLAEREGGLQDRMQALAVAEAQIDRSLTALEAAERQLASTMATASTAAEDDLQRLTAVYENMKPKQAAPVFAAMDPSFAAGFLGRMRPDSAAAILAGLEPEVAYAISALLAGRNADVPTQ